MVCHGELVRLKPDPQHLTSFYVATATGGAVGGIFVGVIAPSVFPGYFELPLTISAACALVLIILRNDETLPFHDAGLSFEWLLLLVLNVGLNVYLIMTIGESFRGSQLAVRNFYGGLRVDEEDEGQGPKRKLTHGTINHGEQYLDDSKRSLPVTYYGFDSGIGRTLLHIPHMKPLHVGVIGLGTGTLATYGKAGDRYRFYEINPSVVDIARKYFFYLKESKAKIDVVLGDARLSLEREQPQHFNVLAVDAFSSDSIPVHLLTREAFGLYFHHLEPDGILAVHVSNRYLDLKPVVYRLAMSLRKDVRVVDTDDDESDRAIFGATWMLVTNDKGFFGRPALKAVAEAFKPVRTPPMWTDDYSNLFTILK
jgi:SAM-dependent methyltransferase